MVRFKITSRSSVHTESKVTKPGCDQKAFAAWYLRGWHRMIWCIPMWAGLFVFIGLVILRDTFGDPKALLVESRKEFLALAPKSIESGATAAPYYRKAAGTQFVPYTGPAEDNPDASWARGDGYVELPHIQAYLKANQAALQTLLLAAARRRADWKLNYSNGAGTPLPHLAELRLSSRLMALYACERAHAGKHLEAAGILRALFSMSRHAEEDPFLMCGLVSVVMGHIGLQALEAIIQWDPPKTVEQLQGYRDALWIDQKPYERLAFFLDGEKKMMVYNLDQMCAMVLKEHSYNQGLLWYGSERKCLIGVFDELLKAAREHRLREYRNDEGFHELVRRHQTGPVVMTKMVMPVFGRIEKTFLRFQDQTIVMDVALALLQHRLSRKRDPRRLNELIPEFLPALPVEWYSQKPIRIRTDPLGVVAQPDRGQKARKRLMGCVRVYGVGVNGKDDNGYDIKVEQIPDNRYEGEPDDNVVRLPPLESD